MGVTARASSLLRAAAPVQPLSASSSSSSSRSLHSASYLLRQAKKGGQPARPPVVSHLRQAGNTAADIRRIYREQQRQSMAAAEAFPWEMTEQKVTAWEPKYEDERKFYYASKVQEGKKNLSGTSLRRYLGGFGSRYLLSKYALRSGASLPTIRMTSPHSLRVELTAPASVLNYWFMNLQTGQRPVNTVKIQKEMARIKISATQMLKLRLAQRDQNLYDYLVTLHELWPRKDERDLQWHTLPRKEHGQYRLTLSRVLAEGPSKPLNAATQAFIDHIRYQLSFHFREKKWQNRNMHWLQFMGIPGIKVTKKWGGEIPVPKLRAREE